MFSPSSQYLVGPRTCRCDKIIQSWLKDFFVTYSYFQYVQRNGSSTGEAGSHVSNAYLLSGEHHDAIEISQKARKWPLSWDHFVTHLQSKVQNEPTCLGLRYVQVLWVTLHLVWKLFQLWIWWGLVSVNSSFQDVPQILDSDLAPPSPLLLKNVNEGRIWGERTLEFLNVSHLSYCLGMKDGKSDLRRIPKNHASSMPQEQVRHYYLIHNVHNEVSRLNYTQTAKGLSDVINYSHFIANMLLTNRSSFCFIPAVLYFVNVFLSFYPKTSFICQSRQTRQNQLCDWLSAYSYQSNSRSLNWLNIMKSNGHGGEMHLWNKLRL